ncbi:MAG: sulfite exporter TauE/SafE family protein [Deltaproteobacteria bacterium]|nr:sulfite exporter TauE/SafE family protein [Deltaproteobacteria bacterium]
MDPVRGLLIAAAAATGGAINAIAGGGTLITFPAIVALGLAPLSANATSTVALLPAAIGSMWGYRRHLEGARRWIIHFTLPSLLGGATGAWALLHTPNASFERVVPFLVAGATLLFAFQKRIQGGLKREPATPDEASPDRPSVAFVALQFAVGVYGGYFGAGIGVLMLAVLGLMGLTDIHRMNGLKNWGGLCMNGVAAIAFARSGLVDWPVAGVMAAGALAGGYGGSRLAQHVGRRAVQKVVIGAGTLATVWLFARAFEIQ